MVLRKFTRQVVHVWKLVILVIPLSTPQLANLNYAIFFMFLRQQKNIMYVHHFALDNNVFFEIHPWFFLIKDHDTRTTLLKGRCHDGLYHIPASYPVKLVFGFNKPSIIRWHDHLGYPSFQIVQRILREFSLPFEQESNKDSVCGPCQQAKSHQLPYPKYTSVFSHPLELIFSNVWGLHR
jgi:hypothetical protein